MKDTKPIDPSNIRDSADALFKKHGKKIKQISFLGRGEGSAVFKINTKDTTYCLKTALYPERTQKILNEARIRDSFIEKGLQFVPTPRYVDQEFFRNGAVVYDFIEGKLSVFNSVNMIKQMANCLAEIHKLDYEIIQNGLDHMMKNHHALQRTMNYIETDYPHLMNPLISEAFSEALREYKTSIQENKDLFPFGIIGILHGDLSDNFITDPQGKIWLVDWENSENGDILDEICTFVFNNGIKGELRDLFFKAYKKYFSPLKQLNLEQIGEFYWRVVPAFNLCWGIDQLDTNLIHNLEPERKLRDIAFSAKNWGSYFSEATTNLIKKGVANLTLKLVDKYNLSI